MLTPTRLVAGVGLALVLGGAATGCSRSPSVFEQAQEHLEPSAFGTAREGAETLAAVGRGLFEAGRRCQEADAAGPRCEAMLSASAYAQVLAAQTESCTAPGREEARRAMVAYLQAADQVSDGRPEVPDPPPRPECR